MAPPALKKLKTSVFERTLSVAKVSLKAGRSTAQYSLKKALGGREDLAKHLVEQAELLTSELGELKGSLMKAGQMLSVYGERIFPPEVAAIFRKLQTESQPVAWEVMEGILQERLGPDRLNALQINPEPVGAASLGQVYFAREKETGTDVALKVQYPGIEKAIDSDIRLLRVVLKSARVLPSGGGANDWDSIFDELRDFLKQEADTLAEAEMARLYYKEFRDDSKYDIPKVLPRYTVPGVLGLEYVESDSFSVTSSLTQTERDKLGTWVLELFFQELFRSQVVQTDAHFGNYRIRRDSRGGLERLVLLDFGAVKILPPEFAEAYKAVVQGLFNRDRRVLVEACKSLGLIADADSATQITAFCDFAELLAEPFSQDCVYDFGKTDISDRARKGSAKLLKEIKFRVPARDQILIDRKIAGLFTQLHFLGARLNCRKILAPYLE